MHKRKSNIPSIGVPYHDADDVRDLMMVAARQNATHYPDLTQYGVYRIGTPWGHERVNRIRLLPEIWDAESVDCDDLAPARAAELWLAGETDAYPDAYHTPQGFHAIVVRGDGTIEDPSVALHASTLPVIGQVQRQPPTDDVEGAFHLSYDAGDGPETISAYDSEYPGDDVGGIWDYLPRLLAAGLPLGATVLGPAAQIAYPTLYDLASRLSRSSKTRPEPRSVLAGLIAYPGRERPDRPQLRDRR